MSETKCLYGFHSVNTNFNLSKKMGLFISCCKSTSSESGQLVSAETKRLRQAEAAERRIKEQENRGIKDPARLKQKTQRLEELERKQEEAIRAYGKEGPKLTWTVG